MELAIAKLRKGSGFLEPQRRRRSCRDRGNVRSPRINALRGRRGEGDWDDGALLPEQYDEWAVERRQMSLDTHETLSDDPQAKLARIAAAAAGAIVEFGSSRPPLTPTQRARSGLE